MIPFQARGRRLIVVYENSSIETFALDRCFGGDGERARITYTVLSETLQELLGPSHCHGKKWFALNGFKAG
jgi:hypothetical protein